MNLTTKARYAVMAMADLAINYQNKPVTLADIGARQHITLNYLEQIFMKLRKKGLVQSVRGPGGGYIIVSDISDIKISDIIDAVDESLQMTRCSSKNDGCMHSNAKCITHNLWAGLSQQIHLYLNSVSLADLCNKNITFSLGPAYKQELAI